MCASKPFQRFIMLLQVCQNSVYEKYCTYWNYTAFLKIEINYVSSKKNSNVETFRNYNAFQKIGDSNKSALPKLRSKKHAFLELQPY